MSPSDSESSSSGLRITDGLAALPCNPWLNTDDDSDFSGGSVFGDWLPSPNQPRVSLDARASNLHSPREIISLYHFPLLRRFRPSRAHLRHPQQLLLPLSNHSDRPERYHAWYTTIKGSVPEDLWRYLDPEGNAEFAEPEPITPETVREGAQSYHQLSTPDQRKLLR